MDDATKHSFDKQEFWQFSFDFYQSGQVQESCLVLQEEYGFNVNLILFIVWVSQKNPQLIKPEQIALLVEAIEEADGWVSEFRQYRRELWRRISQASENNAQDIKQALLDAELTLEARVQQELIDFANQHFSSWPHRGFAGDRIELDFIVSENLDTYFRTRFPGKRSSLWQLQRGLIEQLIQFLAQSRRL
ncbi:TIGR02444 family protein [Pleionea sp. CnH1-48]|uniref:TIGR02444 family protein n=1 Tax=Pleionea sp. CnH1-48 TaxID=2954494 RepID=UPI0020974B02|nr:TIGR02444 family protein [Pleionea sp. CnH1-48]MCO7224703.1 TIGR02444 family protein [Pleionea sp. CnH1-48]